MRKRLYADKGKKLTNGVDFYGVAVDIGEGVSESDYYEITEEEYEKIMRRNNETEAIADEANIT